MLRKLYRIGVLSPFGLFIIVKSVIKHGLNLMVLLEFASKWHFKFLTFNEKFTYNLAYHTALNLAKNLKQKNIISEGNKIAFLCKNHHSNLLSLFACSRLGANITFLNTEMSSFQLEKIINQKEFDVIILDDIFEEKLKNINNKKLIISDLEKLSKEVISDFKLKSQKSGMLNVLTGGTSGNVKIAQRKPSINSIIFPFLVLLKKLDLDKYKSVYIAVPIYHGYGLASVLLAIVLGAKFYMSEKFNTEKSLTIISEKNIEVVIIVPTQLKRMLNFNAEKLRNVQRILSGGAFLHPNLVAETFDKIGKIVFNLYGTSEVGFSVLATPLDLEKYPNSIGKPFKGVKVKLINSTKNKVNFNEVGELLIKTSWGISSDYFSTGDLAYQNSENFLFLKGRIDDMIVSGGENVYPKDLEETLSQHPEINEVAVIGVGDNDFGKRLIAFVVSKKLTSKAVEKWLKNKVARYQMPSKIFILENLPITETGKISKKVLQELI